MNKNCECGFKLRRPSYTIVKDGNSFFGDIDENLDYAFFICDSCRTIKHQGKRLKKGQERRNLEQQKSEFIKLLCEHNN